MQEVALSNDLTKLTTEIKTYQSIGGQAIFEIGRRLKWVKENDLVHGEFGKWLESIDIKPRQAQRFIKIANEFSNTTTSSYLGMNVLYEIATMPPEERDNPQQLDSGETKKPDEMTVRELRETKKKLKERDSQIEELKNQPPKVIEKEVEVEKVPDDYYSLKGVVDTTKSLNERYERENQQLRSELDNMSSNNQSKDLAENKKKLVDEIASLNTAKNLHQEINAFLQKVTINNYLPSFESISHDHKITNSILDSLSGLEKWSKETKQALQDQNFIEGDITHD
ncbi:DUF3102 domain-containing protein [Levilactobacillus brevis]|uniref:DUF3102 domain-containing protein n=1 Tax=Levilactobacillus brevis TaxID=1580 RepID=UPI0035A37D50